MRTPHLVTALVAGLLIAIAAPTSHAAAEKKPAAAKTKPAASQPAPIDATDANAIKAAVGKRAVVIGSVEKAAWSKSGKVLIITFKAGGDAAPFEAVLFEKNKEAIDKKFNGNAETALTCAMIRVTGAISNYAPKNNPDDKRPQIVINDVKQIDLEK
jgi:hypothetical protein